MTDNRVYQSDGGDWLLVSGGIKARFATEGEAHMAAREQEYIAAVRAASRAIWEGINTLKAAQREWDALDYSAALKGGEGEHAGITKDHVGSVVFDTADALEGVLKQGHATNLARLL